jgi:hypothetical protein
MNQVLGVRPEAGAVIAEDPVPDGEAADPLAHRRDHPGELVTEHAAPGPPDRGEATDEPRVSSAKSAVGPVHGAGVDPHQQFADRRHGPRDIHHLHDLCRAVPDRDRSLHRRQRARRPSTAPGRWSQSLPAARQQPHHTGVDEPRRNALSLARRLRVGGKSDQRTALFGEHGR